MPRKSTALVVAAVGAVALACTLWWRAGERVTEAVFDPYIRTVEPLPPVPWRDPEGDLRQFFPGSTNWSDTTRILSGSRVQAEAILGRPMRADEHVLLLHRIGGDAHEPGHVITRRARGEHGAIEIVLALDAAGALRGLRVQALREPAAITGALTNESWLSSFRGLTADRGFRVGTDLPAVPEEARSSAQAIAEAAHDLLVLFSVGYVSGTATHH